MGEYIHRVLVVVTAADQDRANEAALQFDPAGGDQTFVVGLSPDGSAPATHYWCSMQMREFTYQTLVNEIMPEFPDARLYTYDLDTERGFPQTVLADLGLTPVVPA